MTTIISTLLFIAAGSAHAGTTSAADVTSFFPNTSIALPLNQGMKLEWALQPLEDGATAQALAAPFHFDVDAQGNPWFGAGPKRFLANPLKNIALMTDVPFNSFVWLDGDRILCTDATVGGLASTGKAERVENGLPVLKFVPTIRQTYPGCRLFAGANKALFAVTHNESENEERITVYRRVNGKLTAEYLANTDRKVIAVTGDPDVMFFSTGDSIVLVSTAYARAKVYFKPDDPVTGLAYSSDAGMFYTTPSYVGYVSPDFRIKFMKTPNPEIVLRGGTLYIRLARTFGVVKIEGANRFRNLRSTSK